MAAVYENTATFKDEGYLELCKDDFVKLLKDCEILIKPKPQKSDDKNSKDKGGDKKDADDQKTNVPTRKFDELDASDAIQKIYSFDGDQMDFVDFLEAVVRIANSFPFTDEELADLVTFESKIEYLLVKMDAKFN